MLIWIIFAIMVIDDIHGVCKHGENLVKETGVIPLYLGIVFATLLKAYLGYWIYTHQ